MWILDKIKQIFTTKNKERENNINNNTTSKPYENNYLYLKATRAYNICDTINPKEFGKCEIINDNCNKKSDNNESQIDECDAHPCSFVNLVDKTFEELKKINTPPVNVIMDELKIWGIRGDTLGYGIVLSITTINKNDPSDDLIDLLSKELNKSRRSIIGALVYLINHAKFSNSTYDEIKNISKENGFEKGIEIIYNWVKELQNPTF